MSKEIWKYRLEWDLEIITFTLPVGAKLLTAAIQYKNPSIWFEIDTASTEKEERRFQFIFTGLCFDKPRKYITTLINGSYVFHLYEMIKEQNNN